MSQFRKTPDGMIDYDFYKKDANRLRREARSRFVSFTVRTVCFPFKQLKRFAVAWQSAWPSAPRKTRARSRNLPSPR
jgi:hypothetical protein